MSMVSDAPMPIGARFVPRSKSCREIPIDGDAIRSHSGFLSTGFERRHPYVRIASCRGFYSIVVGDIRC